MKRKTARLHTPVANAASSVKREKHKINGGRELIELGTQPVALRTREFVEGTVQDEEQRVSDAQGIKAALLDFRKTGEVIGEGSLQVAMQIVIAENRIEGNVVLAPDSGFRVPDLPVLGIVAVVNDVPADGDESRILLVDGRNQGVSNGGVCRFCV